MAYDQIVDSALLDTGLKKICDAVRTKGGTGELLTFPDGVAEAIAAIQTGSGAIRSEVITCVPASDMDTYRGGIVYLGNTTIQKPLMFITVLKSYSIATPRNGDFIFGISLSPDLNKELKNTVAQLSYEVTKKGIKMTGSCRGENDVAFNRSPASNQMIGLTFYLNSGSVKASQGENNGAHLRFLAGQTYETVMIGE